MSLEEACADRALLGIALSPRQRDLARLFESYSTVIAAAGRQSGKTLTASAAAVHNLCLRSDLDEIAGGSTRHVVFVGNSREQAGIALSYARSLLERSPLLRSMVVGSRDDRIVLEGGRVMLALPCSDRVMRGLSASLVILDEVAHYLDETSGPQTAERIYVAVRPSLTAYGEHGRLLAISTPLGTSGLFWELHSRASNGELPGAVAFSASTREMNPRVTDAFLEGERAMLGPQDFAREYEAQFTGGTGAFFEDEAVRAVVGAHRELPASEGRDWHVAFDPSFSVDPAAAVVVGRSRVDPAQLVVARVERWLPAKARKRRIRQTTEQRQVIVDQVLDGVAALSLAYGNATVITDAHLPSVVIEGLKARGVRRVEVRAWTSASQTDGFRALRSRVYSGRITLPADDELVGELTRLRSKLRAGQSQIEIPRSGGSHCDSAVALAAGVLEIDSHGVGSPMRGVSGFRYPQPRRRLESEIAGVLGDPMAPLADDLTLRSPDGERKAVSRTFKPWERGRRTR